MSPMSGLFNSVRMAATATLALMPALASAQAMQHHASTAGKVPAPFIASTAKPFSALMQDAMAIMDDGMKHAPMDGVAEHDFVTMMIPHHQGAIDMAKALLLYTQDPELKNLAQGVITEQQNEIRVMQAWLQRYQARQTGPSEPTKQTATDSPNGRMQQ